MLLLAGEEGAGAGNDLRPALDLRLVGAHVRRVKLYLRLLELILNGLPELLLPQRAVGEALDGRLRLLVVFLRDCLLVDVLLLVRVERDLRFLDLKVQIAGDALQCVGAHLFAVHHLVAVRAVRAVNVQILELLLHTRDEGLLVDRLLLHLVEHPIVEVTEGVEPLGRRLEDVPRLLALFLVLLTALDPRVNDRAAAAICRVFLQMPLHQPFPLIR